MAPFSPFPRAQPRGKSCGGSPKIQVLYCSPSLPPLGLGPPRTQDGRGYKLSCLRCRKNDEYEIPCLQLKTAGARFEQSRPGTERPFTAFSSVALVLFFARFLTSSLARKSSFHALFLAGLQVEGVALDLLDNVFLLHLALETAQSVLEGFSLLKSYFCQTDTPPNSSGWTE
jgi:hypothetical protein